MRVPSFASRIVCTTAEPLEPMSGRPCGSGRGRFGEVAGVAFVWPRKTGRRTTFRDGPRAAVMTIIALASPTELMAV
jgi:hypothetical protein